MRSHPPAPVPGKEDHVVQDQYTGMISSVAVDMHEAMEVIARQARGEARQTRLELDCRWCPIAPGYYARERAARHLRIMADLWSWLEADDAHS